jgi:hypothetical protein
MPHQAEAPSALCHLTGISRFGTFPTWVVVRRCCRWNGLGRARTYLLPIRDPPGGSLEQSDQLAAERPAGMLVRVVVDVVAGKAR